jgi:hypothetical protein
MLAEKKGSVDEGRPLLVAWGHGQTFACRGRRARLSCRQPRQRLADALRLPSDGPPNAKTVHDTFPDIF